MRASDNYQAWNISSDHYPQTGSLAEKIHFICGYGILAPSVHNTQPWQFQIEDSRLTVTVPADRRLKAGDPTGRELWLSLGACIENIVVAGRHFGLGAVVRTLGVADEDVVIDWTETKPEPKPELLAAIITRSSNRAPYRSQTIPVSQLDQIQASYHHPDLQVVVSAQAPLIAQLADLTGHGIGLALSNPSFKHELADLLRPSWTRAYDGFTPKPGLLSSLLEAWRTRWLPIGRRQGAIEKHALEHSAAVILVFSRGDTKTYWLEAGRAYQHCALEATRLGLATATTAAVVEASDYHLDIEASCQTKFRLQTVMRLGYQAPAPHAPRRPLERVAEVTSRP